MKRLKDPYTPLIAVSMMLVAVVALLLFTEPPKEKSSPTIDELAPVLGEWVPVWAENSWSYDYLEHRFTLWLTLDCSVHHLNKRCPYEYDPNTQTVTVKISEKPEENVTYTLTKYYDFVALQQGDQFYVRQVEYEAARKKIELELDLQPPEIIQRTEAELAPILGNWKDISGSNNHSIDQEIILAKDMTCTLLPKNMKYRYNYDPDTKTVTVYTSQQQSYATKYVLTESHGFTMLAKANKLSSDGEHQITAIGSFYVKPEQYDAAHEAYDLESYEGKLRRHQATRKILLEGKVSIVEMLPYKKADCLTIYNMGSSGKNALRVYMTALAGTTIKASDALKNVRLVTTSPNDNWSQAELEDFYGVPLTKMSGMVEGHGYDITPDHTLPIDATPEDLFDVGPSYLYYFDLSQKGNGEGVNWPIEDLSYQDLFVFFEIYGEEETFYFQLDN